MDEAAHYELREGGEGGRRLALSGRLLVSTMGAIEPELRALREEIAVIDMSGVTEIDTVGAWVAGRLADEHSARIEGEGERARHLLDAIGGMRGEVVADPRSPVWERVPIATGEKVFAARSGAIGVVGFFGQVLLAFFKILLHPSRFPHRALVRQMELVGVAALPIIGLMSFPHRGRHRPAGRGAARTVRGRIAHHQSRRADHPA